MTFPPDLADRDVERAREHELRSYGTDEVLSALVRIYLHGGPVVLRVNDDFAVESAALCWDGDYLQVVRGHAITDGIAHGVVQVLARFMAARGWQPPGTVLPEDPHQALRTVLDDVVTRYSLAVSGGFPVHAGEAVVHVYPTPFGDTRYWVTCNGHTSTDTVRGGPEEALKAAKYAIDRHNRALGGSP